MARKYCLAAALAVASSLLAGHASVAAPPSGASPALAHYLVHEVVLSDTPTGGATSADCIFAGVPGTTFDGIASLTMDATTGLITIAMRFPTQLVVHGTLGVLLQTLTPAAGSSFAEQHGGFATFIDGAPSIPRGKYTATARVIDAESFYDSVTTTVPATTAGGSCVQTTTASFIRSAVH